ncbi:transmembrane protein 192 isoform X2 [Hyla sarda]|uniref:transmembrane protein 192 isoform X2 n=1 Tax=Hyla sarda TaxID=327740 RepID=UPI0024C34DFE|nr:transmembrane protein 192 isoform X2 [Hyla sarda]
MLGVVGKQQEAQSYHLLLRSAEPPAAVDSAPGAPIPPPMPGIRGPTPVIKSAANYDSSGELTQSADDDCLLDAPLLPSQKLQAEIRPTFHPVPTVSVGILLLLIQVAFVALTCVAVFFCVFNGEEVICQQYMAPFSLITAVVISKVLLWLLHVVNERFIQYQHSKVRSQGYLNLYRSTRRLKTLPLVTHSTGNAAVLLIISATDSFGYSNLYLYLILSVLILELILSVIFVLMYTVRMYKFNRSMPRPDIIEEEQIHAFQSHINPGIGFRERESLEDVIEKQGDTIEYLQRHNAVLSKQILTLTTQQT